MHIILIFPIILRDLVLRGFVERGLLRLLCLPFFRKMRLNREYLKGGLEGYSHLD